MLGGIRPPLRPVLLSVSAIISVVVLSSTCLALTDSATRTCVAPAEVVLVPSSSGAPPVHALSQLCSHMDRISPYRPLSNLDKRWRSNSDTCRDKHPKALSAGSEECVVRYRDDGKFSSVHVLTHSVRRQRRKATAGRTHVAAEAITEAFVSTLVTHNGAFMRCQRALPQRTSAKTLLPVASHPASKSSSEEKTVGRFFVMRTNDQARREEGRPAENRNRERIFVHDHREVPFTRLRILERAKSSVFAASLVALGLGFNSKHVTPTAQAAEDALGGQYTEYSSPDGTFSLKYPAAFKAFSKPLKTHKMEVNFKSEGVKGYEIGVAVDPVSIESLEKFGTPDEVGARVIRVEEGKDGTLDTNLFGATAEKQGDLSLYTLDYFVESTRGFKHFVAKVTIKDNLLYACTAQAKESDYPEVKEELKKMVQSFRVPA